jgi:hypothetical protein
MGILGPCGGCLKAAAEILDEYQDFPQVLGRSKDESLIIYLALEVLSLRIQISRLR